jgi:hypothetical protein
MTKKVKDPSDALRQSPNTTESQALKFTWVGVALLVLLLGGVALSYMICGKAKQEQLQQPSGRLEGSYHFYSGALNKRAICNRSRRRIQLSDHQLGVAMLLSASLQKIFAYSIGHDKATWVPTRE